MHKQDLKRNEHSFRKQFPSNYWNKQATNPDSMLRNRSPVREKYASFLESQIYFLSSAISTRRSSPLARGPASNLISRRVSTGFRTSFFSGRPSFKREELFVLDNRVACRCFSWKIVDLAAGFLSRQKGCLFLYLENWKKEAKGINRRFVVWYGECIEGCFRFQKESFFSLKENEFCG
ncbi:hypothetical protein HNY73_016274 [Argiope bruennichi]|uniref:Uncharacterized protein n=1 Tax=Argiope bruennichi TaxID=94029 RepID=A0A8T0EHZ0_ARGBR|nr:hypothetical protein HNY73_016274 [Argiope bruennichi]